jgi:hypothetical protein
MPRAATKKAAPEAAEAPAAPTWALPDWMANIQKKIPAADLTKTREAIFRDRGIKLTKAKAPAKKTASKTTRGGSRARSR